MLRPVPMLRAVQLKWCDMAIIVRYSAQYTMLPIFDSAQHRHGATKFWFRYHSLSKYRDQHGFVKAEFEAFKETRSLNTDARCIIPHGVT